MDKIKLKHDGKTVYATEMIVDKFEEIQAKSDEVSNMEFNRMIIAECVLNEDGTRVFNSPAEVGKIGLKSYQKLQDTVLMVNGLSEEDEKN